MAFNNYYLLRHISDELARILEGCRVEVCFTRRKNVFEIVFSGSEKLFLLLVDVTPNRLALFAEEIPASPAGAKVTVFEPLEGAIVKSIDLEKENRIVTLRFDTGKILRVLLFGSRANVILLENDADPLGLFFKKNELPAAMLHVSEVEEEPLIALHRSRIPKEVQASYAKMNARSASHDLIEILHRAAIEAPVFRLLDGGDVTVWSEAFYDAPTLKTAASANELVKRSYFGALTRDSATEKKDFLVKQLLQRISRLQKRAEEEGNAAKLLEKAAEARKKADSLMAFPSTGKELAGVYRIHDVYDEEKVIEVKLENSTSFHELAAAFYGKARRLEERASLSDRLTVSISSDIARAEVALEEVKNAAGIRELERIEKGLHFTVRLGAKETGITGVTRKEFEKFEIWIGKNAQGNEKLLQLAHKEDIWMHARGVTGSHVIIRMNRSQTYPPKNVLEKAAQWAAWRSKARGSSLVPVQLTKRKFVRKPKGALPGTVIVQKEEVRIVKPESDGDQDD